MVRVWSLLVLLMVVVSVSAWCPFPIKDYPKDGNSCYKFPFLEDLLSTEFGMGAFHKPDDTLAGLTAWLIGYREDEAKAENKLKTYKENITGPYNKYQKVSVG